MVRLGKEHGTAGRGSAGLGAARRGRARSQVRRGGAGLGRARQGKAWNLVRRGKARRGKARRGRARHGNAASNRGIGVSGFMPQDRIRSPLGSQGRRLTSLDDFAFRVWDQYQLSADDFGVMRDSSTVVRADNKRLELASDAAVRAALDALVRVGLVVRFTHQDEPYLAQSDWQDFQHVEYPRRTTAPKPAENVLESFSSATRKLFRKHPGGYRRTRVGRQQSVDTERDLIPDNVPTLFGRIPDGEPTASRLRAENSGEALAIAIAVAREGVPPEVARFPTPSHGLPRGGVMAGMLPRDHVDHAACSDNFAWCIPNPVHRELVKLLTPACQNDRDVAARKLLEWYPTVWRQLKPTDVIGDAFKFWRGWFTSTFATAAAPAPPSQSPQVARSNVPGIEATRAAMRKVVD